MNDTPPESTAPAEADAFGRTPLHHAAAAAERDAVDELLKTAADPNARDLHGWTPLHFAAQSGCHECVALLLGAGADVSLQDSDGNTALWRAVYWSGGKGAVIGLLRDAGADPLAENKHGVSPVSLARIIDNYDVAQFFADLPAPNA